MKEMIELIDFVVIAIYVDLKQSKLLKLYIKNDLYCQNLHEQLEKKLEKTHDSIKAKFFQQMKHFNKAMKYWKNLSKNESSEIRKEAANNSISLLKEISDK